jgi:hypothetical protein
VSSGERGWVGFGMAALYLALESHSFWKWMMNGTLDMEFSQLHLQIDILWLGESDRSAALSLILTWRARRYAKVALSMQPMVENSPLAPFTCLVNVVEFPRDLETSTHYSLLSKIPNHSKCCIPNCGFTQVANA